LNGPPEVGGPLLIALEVAMGITQKSMTRSKSAKTPSKGRASKKKDIVTIPFVFASSPPVPLGPGSREPLVVPKSTPAWPGRVITIQPGKRIHGSNPTVVKAKVRRQPKTQNDSLFEQRVKARRAFLSTFVELVDGEGRVVDADIAMTPLPSEDVLATKLSYARPRWGNFVNVSATTYELAPSTTVPVKRITGRLVKTRKLVLSPTVGDLSVTSLAIEAGTNVVRFNPEPLKEKDNA
jgi:hypothetical protein